ncbi:PepSY-associated TM helix domain-containing protein [Alteromonas sp. CI.11.F.A3]|uniref:PepSY domain-containing protein n=1 Tax=unclassified Alteromonas TaxID=2614992 RepID=UPI001B39EAB7|nr:MULTISPECIES: PepSY-associated TM helix domain-containing protein [unclassified Alteromonas]MBQ4829488.1 PepSY domain-containing protein [Alteromonas sp. MMG017]WOI38687.1 PepSY-associated TM helix domain-containing protein [Alteromonas sp. CI.11.F.A3]
MKLQNYKSYQQVHIWTGIISGLLLFICFVAGALTMFKAPLNVWAMHDKRIAFTKDLHLVMKEL